MPQDAEANLRDAEAAMKKDETDAKKPERCELKQESDESIASIVTSRGGASFHTASWVVRDVREPREARKQVERVEPCGGSGSGGYRSALDLLRELRELSELSAQPAQPAQPAHLGTRHKKRGQALSNPGLPLVMEHHHVHRYRHRHHRQAQMPMMPHATSQSFWGHFVLRYCFFVGEQPWAGRRDRRGGDVGRAQSAEDITTTARGIDCARALLRGVGLSIGRAKHLSTVAAREPPLQRSKAIACFEHETASSRKAQQGTADPGLRVAEQRK